MSNFIQKGQTSVSLAGAKIEKVKRIDGGIEMESSIPFKFRSIPFCNSNSNAFNSNSGIGIEVNSNSNSGIDPSPDLRWTFSSTWVSLDSRPQT